MFQGYACSIWGKFSLNFTDVVVLLSKALSIDVRITVILDNNRLTVNVAVNNKTERKLVYWKDFATFWKFKRKIFSTDKE